MKMYRHNFKVTGVVSFPIDMLRYDSCRPAHEHDSNAIIRTFDGHLEKPIVEVWCLNRSPGWGPTVERWKSMGWRVMLETLTHTAIEV
jgi:hypothetical protein